MWRTLATLLILSFAAVAADDFNELITKGQALFQAYDLNAAEQAYAQACAAGTTHRLRPAQTAFCENALGAVAEQRGQGDEAVEHYLKALRGWEDLGDNYLAFRITTLGALGEVYTRQYRFPEAEKMLGDALMLVKALAGTRPELYAALLSRSGSLYSNLDQPGRARDFLMEAIKAFEESKQPDAPELASAYSSLGMIDLKAGRYNTAESNLRRALELANGSLGENHPETAGYLTNLALVFLAERRYTRAETLLRRARVVVESRVGPNSVQFASVLAGLASVETALGKFGIAEDCGNQALAILDIHGSPEAMVVRVSLGGLYLQERKTDDAEKILPHAVEAERRLFKDEWNLGEGIRTLAILRAQQKAWAEAEALYREALGIYENALGPDHREIVPILREYRNVLKHQGASKEKLRSIEARERAIENTPSRA